MEGEIEGGVHGGHPQFNAVALCVGVASWCGVCIHRLYELLLLQ
ncbi:hypothetical protein VITFI_CDS1498 [Vitreoscilla filiformis]|uniref:Uncharacterized protein n=1 Tax=Vitreoscilla filiformis TaxID=63 RepID=A0A221KE46_VITFI|nr:hypothetical protein VITFI_CDS1498 [Vitreoscilla filiformis]